MKKDNLVMCRIHLCCLFLFFPWLNAQEDEVEGLQSLFLDGLPDKKRPTKFYAYLGFPTNVTGIVPTAVLVHGGICREQHRQLIPTTA